MKFLKKILFVIITIVIIALIAALFIKDEYAVIKQVEINKSSEEVFDYIKYLKNQDEYSVWAQKDPDMKKDYKGIDGEVGFISSWDSNNEDVGKGEQEIIKIDDGNRIDFEIRFIEPFEATDQAYLTTVRIAEGKTKVSWGFNGKIGYPMNLMLLFMDMEEMLGPDLQKGLESLKSVLEAEE